MGGWGGKGVENHVRAEEGAQNVLLMLIVSVIYIHPFQMRSDWILWFTVYALTFRVVFGGKLRSSGVRCGKARPCRPGD